MREDWDAEEVEVVALDPAMEQVIEQELSEFGRDELAGIWRSLCAMMMLRTANLLHCYHQGKKQKACQQRTALRWMDGGVGVITFSSACETLGIDEEYAKRGLLRHAETRAKPSINREEYSPPPGNHQPCPLSHRKSASFSSGRQFSTT